MRSRALFRGRLARIGLREAASVVALAACTPAHGTLGAVLGQRADGRLFVREVPRDLGAARDGLAPDDEILLIDGKDVRPMDEPALQRALGGEPGTPVKITAVRGDQVVRVTVRRTPARRVRSPAPDG